MIRGNLTFNENEISIIPLENKRDHVEIVKFLNENKKNDINSNDNTNKQLKNLSPLE